MSADHEHGHEHGHEHEHEHGHGHAHGHAHGPADFGTAFVVGIVLNAGFTVLAAIYGVLAHSMALVADAVHNLSDVMGLVMAFGATYLARRQPSGRRTYGLRRTTILAALGNAVLLFVAVGGVAWEAILRLGDPGPVRGEIILKVAAIGVVINGVSAALFLRGRKGDANLRAAFLHLAADAAIALGVVAASIVLLYTGWLWLDPVVSLVVSATILVGTWSLLRESLDLVLDAVPDHIDPEQVRAYLQQLPGVKEVHDLHIWAMSTTETALTAHLVMPTTASEACFLGLVCKELHERFRIGHPTLQVEPEDASSTCRQATAGAL